MDETLKEKRRERNFWNKVIFIPFHECWEWSGCKNWNGYPCFSHSIKGTGGQRAHQYSYWLVNKEIDPTKVIDHICKNRGCVNPSHLRQVSPRENVLNNSVGHAATNTKKVV